MKGDAGRLQSRPGHRKPCTRWPPDELTTSTDLPNVENINESAAQMEIHEHFKLRMKTYKNWAYCIARKGCPEILMDAFKCDLSNDFTLMMNWLAITYDQSRTLLETTGAADESMELNTALETLLRMDILHDHMKGPTLDAFREMIAVLCGGKQGRIPQLDLLANFTEESRIEDQEEAEVFAKVVSSIFDPSCDAPSAMDTFSSSTLLQSAEVMRNAEASSFSRPEELNSISVNLESPKLRLKGGGVGIRNLSTVAHGEGPSVSSLCNGQNSPHKSDCNSGTAQPKPPLPTKPKRDMYAIRNRKVGKAGTHSTSGECFVCGNSDGELLSCGKKYTSSSFCATKFHEKCIEVYNAAEYNVDCLRKIVDETICPLHFCSTCYLERWKTTAVRGKLIECDSCYRAFHEQCSPAGFELYDDVVPARSKEGTPLEVKQTFTRCHSHCDFDSIPLVENKRSHLPFCCECENAGEEPLIRCSQCVRSFHEGCLTLNCVDLHNANPKPLCESCILGETLRIGQPVIAKFRLTFYAATITKLEEYPKRFMKVDKYGKHFNEPGYLSVRWAGCDNLFALLPARSVVAMFTGSYDLIGKRLKELPCRDAWREMEQDLAVPRPTFDYVPEKYTKIKTSVYHPSCPKPRLDACEESDSMCDCPATDVNRCGPDSKCTNRAILQECPEACEAIGSGCNNRGVSRKEVNPAVEIREAPGKGMGAFAARDIPKGAFIAEYAGELISNKEMNRRVAEVTAHRNAEEKHYMMALDSQRIIDCKEKGNDASPNCKVETVYAVVSRLKRPNGFFVKYDKRIMIYTTEDVPAGTELCFNYQMRQYNLGCPLPDCKCGAPNCTGTLGATSSAVQSAPEKDDDDDFVNTSTIKRVIPQARKKRSGKNESLQEPPEKKSKPRSKKRASAVDVSLPLENTATEPKTVLNGRISRPSVTFKRHSTSSRSEMSEKDSSSPLHRSRNRKSKTPNVFKEECAENIVNESFLRRALLKGEALEKRPSVSPHKDIGVINGRWLRLRVT
ncbi:hypothetical protein Q1695_003332 [Nippostrongylus brasiliensis]|nr:hypothetical protein Q1695_003332 [Nippostrongylus brasiliensis]